MLDQPGKTRPCLTDRLLMGRKESNQTNKQCTLIACSVCTLVKVFRINPEIRILRLTFHRKSASEC